MKNCSSIDTDDILFQIVSEAVKVGIVKISGIVCPQGERPDNSEAGVSRGHYNMMLLAGIMEILSATIKEMRVGPSQSVYRNRLQTITSCVLSNQKVVNVVCNKSEDMVRYV